MSKRDGDADDRGDDAPALNDAAADVETSVLAARTMADIAFVEALARILRENNLAEIELTREYGDDDELKVRLKRPSPTDLAAAPAGLVAAPPQLAPPQALAPPAHLPAPSNSGPQAIARGGEADGTDNPLAHPGCVSSPMVGTVYLAPEPGAPSFVAVGAEVAEGQTLLIIEAMKTMNQIPSPRAGVVRRILVENAQPVEFGAPLVIVE